MRDPITKTKRASFALAVTALLLTSCAPPTPSPAPTATPLPSPTPLPAAPATPTPTPEPTSTPTPIPTLPPEQVGGLSGIPDPRAAAPELFDLTRPAASIPQFVNAMGMAGIEVDPQQVVENLRYQPFTGIDGKPYVIGAYHLDPNPATQGETLEGKITLMIAKINEDGKYEWRPYTHGELASAAGILIGVSDSIIGSLSSPTLGEFNQIVLADALWKIPYSSSKSLFPRENRINPQPLIDAVNTAKRKHPSSKLMVFHLNWGSYVALPDWLINGDYSKEQLEQMMLDYIKQVMTPLKGKVDSWVVVNEPFGSFWSWASNKDTRFWYDKLGPDTESVLEKSHVGTTPGLALGNETDRTAP